MWQTVLAQVTDPASGDAPSDGDGLDAWDWTTAGIIIAAALVVAPLARSIVARAVEKAGGAPMVASLLGRLCAYVTVAVGLVYALGTLGVAIGPVIGALGVAGIALAFALQDVLSNFVGGVILQLRRPFAEGDEITSGDHTGRVISVDSRSLTVRTLDGEITRIPNSQVIAEPLTNYTAEKHRRTTLMVGVEYDADLTLCRSLLEEAAASVEDVSAEPPPEAFVEAFGGSSIDIALRYWHPAPIGDMWRVRHDVAVAAKRALDDAGIDIPFPQRVLVDARAGDE